MFRPASVFAVRQSHFWWWIGRSSAHAAAGICMTMPAASSCTHLTSRCCSTDARRLVVQSQLVHSPIFQYPGHGWVLHRITFSLTSGFLRCSHRFGKNTRNGLSRTHLMIGAWMPPPQVFEQAVKSTTFHKKRRFRLGFTSGMIGIAVVLVVVDVDVV